MSDLIVLPTLTKQEFIAQDGQYVYTMRDGKEVRCRVWVFPATLTPRLYLDDGTWVSFYSGWDFYAYIRLE